MEDENIALERSNEVREASFEEKFEGKFRNDPPKELAGQPESVSNYWITIGCN